MESQEIKRTDIALITTEKVMKSFKNDNCYLVATLQELKHDYNKGIKRYAVRTDLATYQTINVYEEDSEKQVNEVEKLELQIVETRQEWTEINFTFALIDKFATQLKPLIPANLTETELEKWKITQMFLIKRKQDAPWGITADKWRVLLPEDLLKEKPNA